MNATLQKFGEQLKRKTSWYWLRVVVIGGLGLYIGHRFAESDMLGVRDLRYRVYQFISDLSFRAPSSANVFIVAVTDEEYWKGELAGRSPIKRDYLAELVERLCAAEPNVIALDFDMRSPVTDGSLPDHRDYQGETKKLAASISSASKECKIVLPLTLDCSKGPGACTVEASVLDGFTFDPVRVRRGYINLPRDIRHIPWQRSEIAEGKVPSFAQAIAALAGGDVALEGIPDKGTLPYGSFMWPEQLARARARLSAGDVFRMNEAALKASVEHKIVLVGGEWKTMAYGRGRMTDSHSSPVGEVSGVYLHGNWVAAILDKRVYGTLPPAIPIVIEIMLVALVAIVFALEMNGRGRWSVVGLAAFGLVMAAYFFWQNLGFFLEPITPIVLLVFHWLYDENSHMRERLKKLEAPKETSSGPHLTGQPAQAGKEV